MNIYFKVVEVQIQALEYIPKLGRDTSHPTTTIITLLPTHILIEGIETFLSISAFTVDIFSFIHSYLLRIHHIRTDQRQLVT
jgi:hypothetical protein